MRVARPWGVGCSERTAIVFWVAPDMKGRAAARNHLERLGAGDQPEARAGGGSQEDPARVIR